MPLEGIRDKGRKNERRKWLSTHTGPHANENSETLGGLGVR